MEAGAGRFTLYNKRLIKLLKDLNLYNIGKINSSKDIISNKKCMFSSIMNKMIDKISKSDDILKIII